MRGFAQHPGALALRRVAAAYGRGNANRWEIHLLREPADLAPRFGKVLVDVRRQRLQRRDVDDAHLVGQLAALQTLAEELVDGGEEGGERLARSGRRGDQRVLSAADRLPAVELRFGGRQYAAGGLRKAVSPPALDDGV